ncbi:MAG TPA: lysylphosphatidylglycerol synthase transmembrane domain-containing protein [Methanothrix sp.]|nr:lysylphosphatidylglycerol synthase transmembrane domain-containing protein [Methanothrix sp.]HPJ84551.1 lysylphosphatidylglycerol synthase transmembrane domain-containing protein [Methanothrix sp.]HPR66985.1 lysylphosphatidylglycerol synthase transmembrane domain-containing protein [Methanothrix sp.]
MVQEIELPTIDATKSTALVVLGLSAYFAYLYHLGFGEVSASLAQVNLAIFGIALILSLLDVVFNALAWKTVVRELDYQISLSDVFFIYMSSIFLNNLIPSGSVSGETARLYFLNKIAGNARLDSSTASVAATRIITAIPFVLGMSLGLGYLVLHYEVPSWALTTCFSMIFIMVSVGALFVGICFSESWLQGMVNAVIDRVEWISHRSVNRKFYRDITRQFQQSMMLLRNRNGPLILSSFWAFAGWLSLNLVAFAAFRSLGVEVPIFAIFAVYSVIMVFQTLPLILPGGLGVVDILMTALFTAVGVSLHDAAAVTILARVAQLWFHTFLGGICTAYLLRKVGKNETKRGVSRLSATGP